MLHITSSGIGAEVGLQFGMMKLRQMKMMGLKIANEAYRFLGMEVSIKILGDDEFIRVIAGGVGFYVSSDWVENDPSSKNGSFVIPYLKPSDNPDRARGKVDGYVHGRFIEKPLSYWVSERLTATTNASIHRAVPLSASGRVGFLVTQDGSFTRPVKNGNQKKPANMPFLCGVFDGRFVYVTFSGDPLKPRTAEVRLANGTAEEPETVIKTFDLTEQGSALADVDFDGDIANDRAVYTWNAHQFPLTFTGLGCFAPDGKSIYLACSTVGNKQGSSYLARHTFAKKYIFAIYLKKDFKGDLEATGSMWGSFGTDEKRANGAWTQVDGGIRTAHRTVDNERTAVLAVYPVKIDGGYRPAALEVSFTEVMRTQDLHVISSRTAGGNGLSRTGAGRYTWTSTAKVKADSKVIADLAPPPSTWFFDVAEWEAQGLITAGGFALDVGYPMVIPELVTSMDTTSMFMDVHGFAPDTGVLTYGLYTERRTKIPGEAFQTAIDVRFVTSKDGKEVAITPKEGEQPSDDKVTIVAADSVPQWAPITIDPNDLSPFVLRYSDPQYKDKLTVGLGHAFGDVVSPLAAIGNTVGVQFGGAAEQATKIANLCAASYDGLTLVSQMQQCHPAGDYEYSQGNEVIKEVFKFTPDIPDGYADAKLLLIDDDGKAEDITADFLKDRKDTRTGFPLVSVSSYTGTIPKKGNSP